MRVGTVLICGAAIAGLAFTNVGNADGASMVAQDGGDGAIAQSNRVSQRGSRANAKLSGSIGNSSMRRRQSKKKRMIIIGIIVALLAAVVIGLIIWGVKRSKDGKNGGSSGGGGGGGGGGDGGKTEDDKKEQAEIEAYYKVASDFREAGKSDLLARGIEYKKPEPGKGTGWTTGPEDAGGSTIGGKKPSPLDVPKKGENANLAEWGQYGTLPADADLKKPDYAVLPLAIKDFDGYAPSVERIKKAVQYRRENFLGDLGSRFSVKNIDEAKKLGQTAFDRALTFTTKKAETDYGKTRTERTQCLAKLKEAVTYEDTAEKEKKAGKEKAAEQAHQNAVKAFTAAKEVAGTAMKAAGGFIEVRDLQKKHWNATQAVLYVQGPISKALAEAINVGKKVTDYKVELETNYIDQTVADEIAFGDKTIEYLSTPRPAPPGSSVPQDLGYATVVLALGAIKDATEDIRKSHNTLEKWSFENDQKADDKFNKIMKYQELPEERLEDMAKLYKTTQGAKPHTPTGLEIAKAFDPQFEQANRTLIEKLQNVLK